MLIQSVGMDSLGTCSVLEVSGIITWSSHESQINLKVNSRKTRCSGVVEVAIVYMLGLCDLVINAVRDICGGLLTDMLQDWYIYI